MILKKISLAVLGFLFFCQSAFSAVNEEYLKRDLSLLYESVLQIAPMMEEFSQTILPIAVKVEASENYMLSISESTTIDSFWERFNDIRISLHTLYNTYRNDSSEDPRINLMRTGSLVGLVYPASILVQRFWDSPRMVKIMDGAANLQIPFGSYISMQNEVFYQQKNLWRESEDKKFLMMFPGFQLEEEAQKWSNVRHSFFLMPSPFLTQLDQLIQLYYQAYSSEKAFFTSKKNMLVLWGKNASYQFKSLFYRNFLKVSTWIGDTKIKRIDPNFYNGTTLIKLKDAVKLEEKLRTGDVMTSRSNWFLSNAFLPGFWPHSFIYLGNVQTFINFYQNDQETNSYYAKRCRDLSLSCQDFVGFLKTYPKTQIAWNNYQQQDDHHFDQVLIEATSEGVHFSSIRHTFLNDYLGVLRPKLTKLQIAQTIENTFYHFGKEYDFYLDWASDDRIVCSELVSKSYKSDAQLNKIGIDFDYSIPNKMYVERVMGRIAIPVVNIVRKAYDENVLKMRASQFDFVAFLKGVQATDSAVYASESEFYQSRIWPKWSFMQD